MVETTSQITPNAAFLKLLTNLLVSLLFIAGLVFAGAGRLDWGLGWLFVAVWGLLKFAHILYLRWHDPALMVERGTSHENTQQYDRRIVRVYSVISFSTFLIAGLDGGRFHWSGPVPPVLILLAYVVYLIGNWISGWAASSNPFFSTESRLQADRNQKVAHSGPYRFVRHPAYSALILLWSVTGILLGSWWAVIPGLLSALMILIRTYYEDRMLRAELHGYAQYAQQVRYRLLPGIW